VKVLLTGGAGFIGSHLLDRLLARGDDVAVIDDFNPFYDPNVKRKNLPRGEFRLYERDVRSCSDLVLKESPDAVIHLAARAGVRQSLANPLLYESVNVLGTLELLEACRQTGTRKFIFASSSSVYGNSPVPSLESDESLDPVSPYGVSKLVGERYVKLYAKLYGINCTCLRFFTVYGPRQRPDMAIHQFTSAIVSGNPIQMFGDGSTERDYTYVTDIVQGILGALDRPDGFAVYNLGNSQTVKLSQVISILEGHIGRKAKIQVMPEQVGDVRRTFASTTLAQRNLGFNPKVEIGEGLQEFVAWFQKRR
jgi:UDP-glucuronate 4-epimerase